MSEIKIKLHVPKVPNFIAMDSPPRPRQEGMSENNMIHIADLSDETLSKLADEWKVELLRVAAIMRKRRSDV